MSVYATIPLRPLVVLPRATAASCYHVLPSPKPSDRPGLSHQRRRALTTSTASSDPSSSPLAFSDWPKCSHPTPYDVLRHPRAAPYTKTNFHQLVKLYHPDSHSSSDPKAPTSQAAPTTTIPSSTRLERYRLVIQAHSILKDPAKRRAYDATGAHWHHNSPHQTFSSIYPSDMSPQERYEAWQKGPYASCAKNGTWEDWERWHAEQARKANGGGEGDKEGYYMSHGAFATLVASVFVVASVVQSARLDSHHANVAEKRQNRQMEIGASLRKAQGEVYMLGREERVVRFVKERENMAFGFNPKRYDEQEHEHAKTGGK